MTAGNLQVQRAGHYRHIPNPSRPFPPFAGHHLWVVFATFHVKDPARAHHVLDHENVLSIDGPACLHCGQRWRADIGAHCPGQGGRDD